MKQPIKLNEDKIKEIVSEKLKNILKEHGEMPAMYYPEKLVYYPEDGKLGGDMGYDFLDKGELGSNDHETIVNGIIDYLTNDYPMEKNDWPVVMFLGNGNKPEKLYISSLDKEYANDISVASERTFGMRIPVEIVGNVTNESKASVKLNETELCEMIAESVKMVLVERSMVWGNSNGERLATTGNNFKISGVVKRVDDYKGIPYSAVIETTDGNIMHIGLSGEQARKVKEGETHTFIGYVHDPGYLKQCIATKIE